MSEEEVKVAMAKAEHKKYFGTSKGLDSLKKIKENDFPLVVAVVPPIRTTWQGETKDELFENVEKELRALAIIKEKQVNVSEVTDTSNYDSYLFKVSDYDGAWVLSKEEYDLLKEVLS